MSTRETSASGAHPVNIVHLVAGVAFAGLTLVWALVVGDVVTGEDVRFLLPVPWVLAGAAGLVGLVASDRRRRRRQHLPAAGVDRGLDTGVDTGVDNGSVLASDPLTRPPT